MAGMPPKAALVIPLPVPQTHHHLGSLAAEVHRTYFFKYPPLPVRWGQQIARKKRRSIRLGSYNHATAEVRIHPILNAANVPAWTRATAPESARMASSRARGCRGSSGNTA